MNVFLLSFLMYLQKAQQRHQHKTADHPGQQFLLSDTGVATPLVTDTRALLQQILHIENLNATHCCEIFD